MNTMQSAKRVVMCADDFGLTTYACESIVELANRGAISATSCVVDGAHTARFARSLNDAKSPISLGLHLNLTAGTPYCKSLPNWLLRTFVLRRADRSTLDREINRQFERFTALFGRLPDFVDGHQHVHQFPIIRDVLLAHIVDRGAILAVRSTVPLQSRGLKSALIASLGGNATRSMLVSRALPTNSDFAGVYRIGGARPFATRIQAWLSSIADGGLIMCHPETNGRSESVRNAEHAFLISDEWSLMRNAYRIRLAPFGTLG
jgi:chitin disaccharide deacetylase